MVLPFDREHIVIDGIPRFVSTNNYSASFGFQWSRFSDTQIDREGDLAAASARRLFIETGWSPQSLAQLNVLEAGSGAGRFTRPLLAQTKANVYSFDYSNAVLANLRTNQDVAEDRLHLFQASILDIPFADNTFDRVLCLGVLQHTPDFATAVRQLVAKCKVGGEIVVDFYAIRGWWTKIHAKYILRPLTKRMGHQRLLTLIDRNADRLIALYNLMGRIGLHPFTRFLPIVDIKGSFPSGLSPQQTREWVVLDTFDMFSPEHDHPQRVTAVKTMFESSGAEVIFAGEVDAGSGRCSVIRAVKR